MKKLITILCFLPFLLSAQEYGTRVRVQPTAGFVGGSVQDFAAWIGGGSGAYVPLTFTDTVEVNTAGFVFRIRDAAGYPDVYMNGNFWTAASDVNTFIDVGSTSGQMQLNSAGRTIIAAATNVELQAGITGEARIDSDSLVLEGVYPVGTASDSVLVRDGATGRVNLRAQSGVGTWLKPELDAGNSVSATGDGTNTLDINTLGGINLNSTGTGTGNATLSSSHTGDDVYFSLGADSPTLQGYIEFSNGQDYTTNVVGGDTATVVLTAIGDITISRVLLMQNSSKVLSEADTTETTGLVQIGDIANGNATAIPGYTSGNVLTTTTLGASLTLSSGTLSTAQSFFNDYDASITLTGVTSTPDTIDADSNTKSNDWGFNPTTSTYTYNGTTGRYYKVSVSAQMEDADASSEVLIITVYKNNTATSAVAQANQQSGTLDPVTMHGQAIILLSNGDTINAKVNSTGGTGDFNLQNYSLILEQL